ncbi:MAG: YaaA family protein, partial [Saprospiraceae bacterium]
MLAILSPSKTMQTSNAHLDLATLPRFTKESVHLAKIIKKMSPSDLQSLMSISPKLSEATYEKFAQFGRKGNSPSDTLAFYAYKGEVYTGLDAASFAQDDLMYAQDHLRILSGLYGVLRPLDTILQYRLEMATRLETKLGTNLYQYWGDKISKAIQSDIKASANTCSIWHQMNIRN